MENPRRLFRASDLISSPTAEMMSLSIFVSAISGKDKKVALSSVVCNNCGISKTLCQIEAKDYAVYYSKLTSTIAVEPLEYEEDIQVLWVIKDFKEENFRSHLRKFMASTIVGMRKLDKYKTSKPQLLNSNPRMQDLIKRILSAKYIVDSLREIVTDQSFLGVMYEINRHLSTVRESKSISEIESQKLVSRAVSAMEVVAEFTEHRHPIDINLFSRTIARSEKGLDSLETSTRFLTVLNNKRKKRKFKDKRQPIEELSTTYSGRVYQLYHPNNFSPKIRFFYLDQIVLKFQHVTHVYFDATHIDKNIIVAVVGLDHETTPLLIIAIIKAEALDTVLVTAILDQVKLLFPVVASLTCDFEKCIPKAAQLSNLSVWGCFIHYMRNITQHGCSKALARIAITLPFLSYEEYTQFYAHAIKNLLTANDKEAMRYIDCTYFQSASDRQNNIRESKQLFEYNITDDIDIKKLTNNPVERLFNKLKMHYKKSRAIGVAIQCTIDDEYISLYGNPTIKPVSAFSNIAKQHKIFYDDAIKRYQDNTDKDTEYFCNPRAILLEYSANYIKPAENSQEKRLGKKRPGAITQKSLSELEERIAYSNKETFIQKKSKFCYDNGKRTLRLKQELAKVKMENEGYKDIEQKLKTAEDALKNMEKLNKKQAREIKRLKSLNKSTN